MFARKTKLATAAAILVLAGIGAATAGPEKVKFRANYKDPSAFVLFNTVDRHDRKAVRFVYISKAADDAAKPGQPIPHGAVILLEERKAKLDAAGNPELDAKGRFIATEETTTFIVMEKQAGWGAEYGPEKRNGEWEYAVFGPNRQPPPNANVNPCFTCHLSRDQRDYTFTYFKNRQDRGN
jgi:hypothetical protein